MAPRQSAGFWRGHLEGWRQSGQTQAAYCATHGLNPQTFNRWQSKERRANATSEPSLTLVPIRLQATATRSVIALHSPSGWRIDLAGTTLGELATVLRQLP